MFLGLAIGIVVLQNILGSSLATVFGLDSKLGLCMGCLLYTSRCV